MWIITIDKQNFNKVENRIILTKKYVTRNEWHIQSYVCQRVHGESLCSVFISTIKSMNECLVYPQNANVWMSLRHVCLYIFSWVEVLSKYSVICIDVCVNSLLKIISTSTSISCIVFHYGWLFLLLGSI